MPCRWARIGTRDAPLLGRNGPIRVHLGASQSDPRPLPHKSRLKAATLAQLLRGSVSNCFDWERVVSCEVVVVVGNGMVSHRFCEKLDQLGGSERYRVIVIGEERRVAYDRVQLSAFFNGKTAEDLALADPAWYAQRGFELRLGERVSSIDREGSCIRTEAGDRVQYDKLVLATGSYPFVPPLPGVDREGVFVYRTIEDLEAIAAYGAKSKRAAVIGGGLLGLEAAKAVLDMGLETHVVEFASRLMPRQLDDVGGALLRDSIESLGVKVEVDARTKGIYGEGAVAGLQFDNGDELPVEMVVISAGIRPRDELAQECGLDVGDRGGIAVDDALKTSDPTVFAIGECALHDGMIYGLVAPGYAMADAVANQLMGREGRFTGMDLSSKLKLMGIDVASFGDPFSGGSEAKIVAFEDRVAATYQKLVLSPDGKRLLGGMLVGDASAYSMLLAKFRSADELPERPAELLFGPASTAAGGAEALPDSAQICSCNDVSKAEICHAIREGSLSTPGQVKACTRAGSGCGGCTPMVEQLLKLELKKSGRVVDNTICEHFPYSRSELFEIVKIRKIRTFQELVLSVGKGAGCEVCKPSAASIFASVWNEPIVDHATIQDTNDRFLANIQRGGTYSVIPRVPGGEITPEKLIVLGDVARRYDLYCKITGGQRIDLLGARVEQLPDIWKELVDAGFESGHAYGKALRTVKSCVGSSWCRFGVQDSTGFAIRIEERYRGIRSPHKVKMAVSGCVRECAEAQSKDVGIIATEDGWNLYVCGNGGANPRHADLIATGIDDETAIRLIDRFFMYYIHTADRLQRTARWLEAMEGGIDYLKGVIVEDSLGIAEQLEKDMGNLVSGYACEWKIVVQDPDRAAAFRHYADGKAFDETLRFVEERDQKRPGDWSESESDSVLEVEDTTSQWVKVASVGEIPMDGGTTIKYGDSQIALFHFAHSDRYFASQNVCPHKRDMVLSRGIVGDVDGIAKVACPLHKKTFALDSGSGISDPELSIATFPVEVRNGEIYVELPSPEALADQLAAVAGCPKKSLGWS